MGMGYAGSFADVIETKTLAKLFPKEYEAFEKALAAGEVTLDAYAQATANDNDENAFVKDDIVALQQAEALQKAADDAFEALCDAFAKKFKGLSLELRFHDADDGDRYDDVSGGFFHVDGLYALTPGAKKLGEKNFGRKFYVTYG